MGGGHCDVRFCARFHPPPGSGQRLVGCARCPRRTRHRSRAHLPPAYGGTRCAALPRGLESRPQEGQRAGGPRANAGPCPRPSLVTGGVLPQLPPAHRKARVRGSVSLVCVLVLGWDCEIKELAFERACNFTRKYENTPAVHVGVDRARTLSTAPARQSASRSIRGEPWGREADGEEKPEGEGDGEVGRCAGCKEALEACHDAKESVGARLGGVGGAEYSPRGGDSMLVMAGRCCWLMFVAN